MKIFLGFLKALAPQLLTLAACLGVVGYAHHSGKELGLAEGKSQCAESKVDQLNELLRNAEQVSADANAASLALNQSIADRITVDQQTTSEIRRALTTTKHLRVDCVLPADVMHQLTAARNRANQAAAGGIDRAVPAAPGTK